MRLFFNIFASISITSNNARVFSVAVTVPENHSHNQLLALRLETGASPEPDTMLRLTGKY
jgi:hypothetical protein